MSEHWANKQCMKIRRVGLLATEGVYLYLLQDLCTNNNTDVSLIVLMSPSEDNGCNVGLHSLYKNKNANNTSEVIISFILILG